MPSLVATNVSLSYPVFVADPTSLAGTKSLSKHAGALALDTNARATSIQALRDISFECKPGDRVGLIGRNGSGKSTLLRVLAGVYEPTEGAVCVEGRVAPMFSVGLGVRRDATGRKNIFLRGLMHGLSRKEARSRVQAIADFSELGPFVDLPVRTYSSGMAMRLSFAMATAFSPDVLLLDEWIGAGDERFQKKASARMHEVVEQSGITVLASHRRALVKEVCNLGLWLDGGEQRAFGPIEDVYASMDAATT